MNHEFYQKLTCESPIAYVYLKIICSQEGNPSDCMFLDMNQAFEKLTRQKASELIGKKWSEISEINPEDTANLIKVLSEIRFNNSKCEMDYYSNTLKPQYRLFAYAPEENNITIFMTDITDLVTEMDILRQSEKTFRLIKDSVRDCIWVFHVPTMRFIYASSSVQELLGYTPEEALNLSFENIFTSNSMKIMKQALQDAVAEFRADTKKTIHNVHVVQHLRKDGTPIWVEMNSTYRFNNRGEIEVIGVSRDVDERIKREDEISYLNTHDPLTGLMNRNALRLLKDDLERRDPLSGKRSVIAIDIDNFRIVNDALGHRAGDQMIIDLSQKITSCIGDRGYVYHTDGDEFVIILESTDSGMIHDIAIDVLRNLSNQIMINNRPYFVTASIGIGIGTPGETLVQTVKNADTALYIAKKNKNSIKIYTLEMQKARTRDAILEDDLRCALEKGQLEIYYQPIYDVRKGVINQAEALLRWNHPELGRISPGEFIPIAERTKLILPITDWVIKQSCLTLTEWKAIGIEGVLVSVNLTFISFENRSDELTAYIARSIKESGIEPSNLKIEITESTLMHNADEIIKAFHDLKKIGVKLALDDFGTGYSSFGYMKVLPLDIMKLDRSLISDIEIDEKEQMIVSTMITIIHGLGLEVVVEGVETKEQYEKLKQYDCDYIQGFLFSRPLPADEFVKYYHYMKENQQPAYYSNDSKSNAEVRFEWQEEWNSGNDIIDRQHRSLMQIANQLFSFSLIGIEDDRLLAEIDRLIQSLADHFEYEENVLKEVEFYDCNAHMDLHRRLLLKAKELRTAFIRGEIKSWPFFSFVIDDIIVTHLKDEDMKFFSYLIQENHL